MALAALSTKRVFVSARSRKTHTFRCHAGYDGRAHQDASAHRAATTRRVVVGTGMATLISLPMASHAADSRIGEVKHTETEWRDILGDSAFHVMREAGTERPFTSPLNNEKRSGTFVCAGCGTPLFKSETKYNSGTGWPSFYDVIPGAVDKTVDFGLFLPRTEVRCHKCQGHLGHVFEDGPRPTGLRYCMNGVALKFEAEAA